MTQEAIQTIKVIDLSDFQKEINRLIRAVKKEYERKTWSLTITSEINCYILEGIIDGVHRRWSIEEDEKDALKMHQELLWDVMSYFCFSGSKHDKERIQVIREKGSDYIDPERNQD